VYHFAYVRIQFMFVSKSLRKILILILFVVTLLVLFSIYLIKSRDFSSTKDDSYFTSKYRDLKDHDTCVAEFEKRGRINNGQLGIPCPGEPQ